MVLVDRAVIFGRGPIVRVIKSFLWFVHEVNIASIVNDERGRGAELEHRALALRGKLAELRVRQDQTFELMEKTKAIDSSQRSSTSSRRSGHRSRTSSGPSRRSARD
jgi:hypothetical protein